MESDLKQENEQLKGRIEELTKEVEKLRDGMQSTEELSKKLKEVCVINTMR